MIGCASIQVLGLTSTVHSHAPDALRRRMLSGSSHLPSSLGRRLGASVRPGEAVGWDGDALEAQAFAYLAVRSVLGLPLSLPSTTGVIRPTGGGRLFRAFPAPVP